MTKKPQKQKLDSRHEARKLALQALFESSFHECELLPTAGRIKEFMQPSACDSELVESLLKGVQENLEELDSLIARGSPEWPIHQLPKVDLNILRIAIYELHIAQSVPPKVAIDEAVELAKEFSGDSSAGFVNGALGTIIKLKDKSTDTALFVGRFQPLHKGHLHTLREIANRFPHIVVIIGSSEKSRTKDNPLSGAERQVILEDVLNTMSFELDQRQQQNITRPQITIVQIEDVPSDEDWAKSVIESSPDFGIVYSNNEPTFQIFEKLEHPVFKPGLHKREDLSGTNIRNRIKQDKSWDRLVPTKVKKYLEDHDLVEVIQAL